MIAVVDAVAVAHVLRRAILRAEIAEGVRAKRKELMTEEVWFTQRLLQHAQVLLKFTKGAAQFASKKMCLSDGRSLT